MAEQTVMSPKVVALSFQSCKLSEMSKVEADEFFHFVYPSPSVLNEMNGDGDLYEIFDTNDEYNGIDTIRGWKGAHPDLKIYYPCPKNILRIVIEAGSGGFYHLQANRGSMKELHWSNPTDEAIEKFGYTLFKSIGDLQDTVVLVQRIHRLTSDRQNFDTFIGKMKTSISKHFKVDEESVDHQ